MLINNMTLVYINPSHLCKKMIAQFINRREAYFRVKIGKLRFVMDNFVR